MAGPTTPPAVISVSEVLFLFLGGDACERSVLGRPSSRSVVLAFSFVGPGVFPAARVPLGFLISLGIVRVSFPFWNVLSTVALWGWCRRAHGFLGLFESLLFFNLYASPVSSLEEAFVVDRVFLVLIEPHVQYAIGHSHVDLLPESFPSCPSKVVEGLEFRHVCTDGPLVP